MFKSLIATCLIAGAVGLPTQASSIGGNALQGHYCFRSDYITDWDVLEPYYDDYISFNFVSDNTNNVYIYAYENSSSYDTFMIQPSGYVQIYLEYGEFNLDYLQTYGGVTYHHYFDYTTSYDLNSDFFKRFYIYFENPIYLTQDEYNFFNTYFTNLGNDYCERYTGWFTFNNNVSLSGSNYLIIGNITVNNIMYGGLAKASDSMVVWGNIPSYNSYVFYHNGAYDSDFKYKNSYLTNVMLTATDKTNMSRVGVFEYIPFVHEYTFGEMIFNIMDAPVYMLTKLLSFELFGIEVYVGLFSVFTVVLICFIIKKVV